MFKLSCFSPNHYTKTKKVQHVGGKVHSRSEDQERKVDYGSASTTPKVDEDENLSPSSHGDCWASECLDGNMENSKEFLKMSGIKKSQSLGCILVKERDFFDDEEDVTDDDELDRQFSFKYLHENKNNMETIDDSLDDDDTFFNQHEENGLVEPFDMIKDEAHHESLFSIQVLDQFDSKHHIGSGNLTADNPPLISRSRSIANLGVNADNSPEISTRKITRPLSKSFEISHSPEVLPFEMYHDVDKNGDLLLSDTNGDWEERFDLENKTTFKKSDYHHEYITPANDIDVKLKNLQQESFLIEDCDELSPKEFSTRRIEEWINQIDIGESSIIEEPGESLSPVLEDEPQVEVEVEVIVPPTLKPDSKSNLAMKVAYNYVSSLTPTSTTAQMANIGLIAIPLLSGFSSLRVLNLSGNSIARITAGSLPRGLHMLNLSKNNIGVIEGLRDLTRLRVLDLSYNRIVRIGHGLASCSSLKELYLSGNKISEVEGLHRLLKLNLLDLKGNKISTAKGLGQLAANYASLQAINLEGNPAQRNLGDEQLKKYLHSLLPNLVHYNKHTIKSSGLSDLPPRSLVAHQFDRCSRTDHKLPRRGSHGSGLNKLGSNPVRPSHAVGHLLKQSKGRNVEARHVRLPPMGSKPANNLPETDRKMVSLKPSNPIRRSRSEGTL